MTGLGLAVAIPAVLAYNICVRANRGLAHDLQDQAHSLLIDTMLQQDSTVKSDVKLHSKVMLEVKLNGFSIG